MNSFNINNLMHLLKCYFNKCNFYKRVKNLLKLRSQLLILLFFTIFIGLTPAIYSGSVQNLCKFTGAKQFDTTKMDSTTLEVIINSQDTVNFYNTLIKSTDSNTVAIELNINSIKEAKVVFSHFQKFSNFQILNFNKNESSFHSLLGKIKTTDKENEKPEFIFFNNNFIGPNLIGYLPDYALIPEKSSNSLSTPNNPLTKLTIIYKPKNKINLIDFKSKYETFQNQSLLPTPDSLSQTINTDHIFKREENADHLDLAEKMGFSIKKQRYMIKKIEDALLDFLNYTPQKINVLIDKILENSKSEEQKKAENEKIIEIEKNDKDNEETKIAKKNQEIIRAKTLAIQSHIHSEHLIKLQQTNLLPFITELIKTNSPFLFDLITYLLPSDQLSSLFQAFQQFIANNSTSIIYNTGSYGITFYPSNKPNSLIIMSLNEINMSLEESMQTILANNSLDYLKSYNLVDSVILLGKNKQFFNDVLNLRLAEIILVD